MPSEHETVEEVRDRTPLVWGGIIAALVLMIALLAMFGQTEPLQSPVTVRHILVETDFNDPAERTRALQQIEDLRERIVEGGESFDELARDYSSDPASSSRGGLLPPKPRGAYEESFDEWVWAAPIGEVSPPIRTSYGYHLVKVEERNISEADRYEQELKERALENPDTADGED